MLCHLTWTPRLLPGPFSALKNNTDYDMVIVRSQEEYDTMTIRERLHAFWCGQPTDRIPYTVYCWNLDDFLQNPDWMRLLKRGLGLTMHVPATWTHNEKIEYKDETYTESGKHMHRRTIQTPVGEIYETFMNGWRQRYLLETAEDYKVMQYIVRHDEILPNFDHFRSMDEILAPYGAALMAMGRTPLQTINIDYVGLENFALHLYDYEEEIAALYELLLQNYTKTAEITAEGPGTYISALENFTADSIGPVRYQDYLVPVYKKLFPQLQSAGKVIGTHYDGRLDSCKEIIASAPIDIIESLTEPPEGDMRIEDCRCAWPDKRLWCNFNVARYGLPPQQIKDEVERMARQGRVDGALFALEVSEDIPQNWQTSLDIVLDAIEEIG